METFGDLADRLSIARIRFEKLNEEGYDALKIDVVEKQISGLCKEMSEYIGRAIRGEVIIEAPKVKIYHHEEASGSEASDIGEAISKLNEANYKLWNLEDFRRDKSNSDQKRLKACDEVSDWNRKRNDCIDLVNRILSENINANSKYKDKNPSSEYEN